MKLKNKQIEEILSNFNFEKVRLVMKFLDWRWALTNEVPTIGELKQEAERLLRTVKDENLCFLSCGGFFVSKFKAGYRLSFDITEWDTFK